MSIYCVLNIAQDANVIDTGMSVGINVDMLGRGSCKSSMHYSSLEVAKNLASENVGSGSSMPHDSVSLSYK
jgi:hypothetical protein